MAITLARDFGFISISQRRMPEPSTWKTPAVSPRPNNSYVPGSSTGILSRFRSMPCRWRMKSQARAMMVRVARPRKSTLSSPNESTTDISNCVTVFTGLSEAELPVGRCRGMYSTMGLSVIITPAAWVPALRTTPSICLAVSISSRR